MFCSACSGAGIRTHIQRVDRPWIHRHWKQNSVLVLLFYWKSDHTFFSFFLPGLYRYHLGVCNMLITSSRWDNVCMLWKRRYDGPQGQALSVNWGIRLCVCDEETSLIHHRVWSSRGPRFPHEVMSMLH